MKTLLFGGTGQVGRSISSLIDCIAPTRREADFSAPLTLLECLDQHRPQVVINSAAFTNVDMAEQHHATTLCVNALAPKTIAEWCEENDALLIHLSTEYVFSGKGYRPWTETDPIAPINFYGHSKGSGEVRIAQSECRYLILRTSWVYDHQGVNFLTRLRKRAQIRDIPSVAADQHGAPTYAPHLAQAVLKAVEVMTNQDAPSGIVHVCNSGEVSRHGFAEAILGKSVQPGLSDPAVNPQRPKNSRLNTEKALNFGIRLPHWSVGLDECLKKL